MPDSWQYIGRGCEGIIEVAQTGCGMMRRKTFFRANDMRRYVITALLVDHLAQELGYGALLRVPHIVGFHPAARIVISDFIIGTALPDARTGASRAAWPSLRDARNAGIAVAGYIDDLSAAETHELIRTKDEAALALLPRAPSRGLDLNDSNWVFDGARWALIDH